MAIEIKYLSGHSNLMSPEDEDMRFANCNSCDNCDNCNSCYCNSCEERTAYESEEDYMQFETEEEAIEWDRALF